MLIGQWGGRGGGVSVEGAVQGPDLSQLSFSSDELLVAHRELKIQPSPLPLPF